MTVDITAPSSVRYLKWNRKTVSGVSRTKNSTLTAKLADPETQKLIKSFPEISKLEWKSAESLVERLPYTLNPTPPETFPVLCADDYGYRRGIKFYRGKFSIPENELLVVLDNMGHHQNNVRPYGLRNPRGISHASLDSGSFSEWKIIDNAGG
ncbi:hypothetical protein L211DRAFT_847383 [Terfezia boudieri ATCC MYA-4762]|uniref:Beta-galactosidase jelly roll domain-containing protein n=1 Tax=Terfezia boudieri ATCC MYA-4762 TaxID=1051890 RepID=A0A3N4LXC8_9PEZI|nr:hypothetical protein L211DRAFT_847383 [Terfezia boudieri ATCC MYA-4762]